MPSTRILRSKANIIRIFLPVLIERSSATGPNINANELKCPKIPSLSPLIDNPYFRYKSRN